MPERSPRRASLQAETADAKWVFIRDGLSRFAGHPLELDKEVYQSEAAANFRNRGIAKLLEGYGRMYFDALEATDIYTKQCSLAVTVKDLAGKGRARYLRPTARQRRQQRQGSARYLFPVRAIGTESVRLPA